MKTNNNEKIDFDKLLKDEKIRQSSKPKKINENDIHNLLLTKGFKEEDLKSTPESKELLKRMISEFLNHIRTNKPISR